MNPKTASGPISLGQISLVKELKLVKDAIFNLKVVLIMTRVNRRKYSILNVRNI